MGASQSDSRASDVVPIVAGICVPASLLMLITFALLVVIVVVHKQKKKEKQSHIAAGKHREFVTAINLLHCYCSLGIHNAVYDPHSTNSSAEVQLCNALQYKRESNPQNQVAATSLPTIDYENYPQCTVNGMSVR